MKNIEMMVREVVELRNDKQYGDSWFWLLNRDQFSAIVWLLLDCFSYGTFCSVDIFIVLRRSFYIV
jgi:hypothetical protein